MKRVLIDMKPNNTVKRPLLSTSTKNSTVSEVHLESSRLYNGANNTESSNAIDWKRLYDLVDNKSQDFENYIHVNDSFIQLYRQLIWRHQSKKLKELPKKHMSWIIRLMDIGKLTQASNQILTLYNETNLIQADNLHDILLSDFGPSNEHYLATLKILTMQLILKTHTTERYAESLLELFAHDSHYLLRDSRIKTNAIVKLILNFFTLLPQYKPLFALKFIQYMSEFELDFEAYIKNMDFETFQKQIPKLLRKENSSNCVIYLNKYYNDYLTKATKSRRRNMESLNLREYLTGQSVDKRLFDDITKELRSSKLQKGNIDTILRPLLYHPALSKETTRTCDNIILFMNKSIRELHEDVLLYTLTYLFKIFLLSNDLKRCDNVSAVMYNCFVIKKKLFFLERASVSNYKLYLKTNDIVSYSKKFERLIGCCSDKSTQKSIFAYCCNIFMTFQQDDLNSIWTLTRKYMLNCFRRLKLEKFEIFRFSSEPILCFLYSGSNISNEFKWSPLCRSLNAILTNNYEENIELDFKVNALDSLAKYEVLIKSIYCLNYEMKKNSCLYLRKIFEIVLEKWINPKSNFNKEEELSDLEITFFDTLIPYLHQNKIFKLSTKLCLSLLSLPRYNGISGRVKFWLLESYIGLQLNSSVIATIKQYFDPLEEMITSLKDMSIHDIYVPLCAVLSILSWKKDSKLFNNLINDVLKTSKPQLFDIQNKSKMNISDYLKVLMLNIKLTHCASQIQFYEKNVYASLKELKRSLKICRLLIGKETVLSANYRFEVIALIDDIFRRIINVYVHTGVFKDCAFFTNEYQRVILALDNPTTTFNLFACLYSYYELIDEFESAQTCLKKLNTVFDQIDGSINIDALGQFLYLNKEYEKLVNSMELFFEEDASKSEITDYWLLKTGQTYTINNHRRDFDSLVCMNNAKDLYNKVKKQLNADSFFKSMHESVMTIPSCNQQNTLLEDVTSDPKSLKAPHFLKGLNDSPRPSSLTPRGKSSTNKSFNRGNVVNNLQMMIRFIQNADTTSLKSYEVRELANLYSLTLSIFFNISTKTKLEDYFIRNLELKDRPRSLSLFYEKSFSDMGTEIYETFIPDTIKSDYHEIPQSKYIHSEFGKKWSHLSFSVVELDVCELTGDLLITRFDTIRNKHLHLRLPLNRHNSRDLGEDVLDFNSALKEIDDIITSNNMTTSADITSAITTKEQRKGWWDERYSLDTRLGAILSKIEDSWFCGFKGIFNPQAIDDEQFNVFKKGFESILYSQLPSRKLQRQSASFIQIDDMLIELFVLLDVINQPTEKAVSMMEDLIYFIFDALLFHGEENAYDEIDVNLIHIKFEELLEEYNASIIAKGRQQTVNHTFLILGNKCHSIPWESLNFMKDLSVSRVPSLEVLDQLLTKNSELEPEIDISRNLAFVLNPGNDLNRSEMTFGSDFKALSEKTTESKAYIGKAPSSDEFYNAVAKSNLFVYIGHSGGEQYVKLKNLRKCQRLAPSLLFGCSSAHLRYCGSFESSGTVYSYLLGGSPMVVGNLWDVTDKDTDKLTMGIFEKTGLVQTEKSINGHSNLNVSEAIAQSRSQCNMKYLNGAAMVVYGLPMKFTRSK